jgi:hypothetical protein
LIFHNPKRVRSFKTSIAVVLVYLWDMVIYWGFKIGGFEELDGQSEAKAGKANY